MFQQQVVIINNFLMAFDALCILLAGWCAHLLKRYLSGGKYLFDPTLFIFSIIFVALVNNYVMGRINLYSDKRPTSYYSIVISVFQAIVVDFIMLGAALFVLKGIHYSREFFLFFAIFSFVFIITERILVQAYLQHFTRRSFHARHLLLVGDEERGRIVAEALEKQLSWGHKILKHLVIKNGSSETSNNLEDLTKVLRDYPIDEVVFAIGREKSIDLPKYLDICRKMGVSARILPGLWSPQTPQLSVERVQGIPFLTLHVDNFNATGLLYKRILDILGGLMGTAIFLLIYPFVALAIKLDSPGPVLFKQKRVGQHGRVFTLYKFRTMYVDAEERKRELLAKNVMKGPIFKLKNDPRITRVGRFLRKTSLDEFPQFINVLKGEMSLVGTRPPTLDEIKDYKIWHHRRISIKPGITGLWQISGRNKITDFDKIVELDCKYLENWRFMDDIKIILKTIVVVLQRKGAI